MLQSTAGILIKQSSDHQPYFLFIETVPAKKFPRKLVKIHLQNEKAMSNFANEIINSNIMEKLDQNPLSGPNNKYNILMDVLENANVKHMLYQLVTFNKYKHKNSLWITNGILNSIKHRDNLHKQIKLTNPTSIGYSIKKINLKTYNCILKRSIRAAKLIYYEQLFNKYKNYTRKTWKSINNFFSNIQQKEIITNTF